MSRENIIKLVGYLLIATLIVAGTVLFVKDGQTIINNTTEKIETLGTLGNEGEYTVATTNDWDAISYGTAILHKVIMTTANDSVYIADGTTTPSTNKAFQITATVPGTFDVEAIFESGIVANVTSSTGAVFIYSHR
jgi:hypothetical protein